MVYIFFDYLGVVAFPSVLFLRRPAFIKAMRAAGRDVGHLQLHVGALSLLSSLLPEAVSSLSYPDTVLILTVLHFWRTACNKSFSWETRVAFKSSDGNSLIGHSDVWLMAAFTLSEPGPFLHSPCFYTNIFLVCSGSWLSLVIP